MPSLNSKVFYFLQGHAKHTQANIDFSASLRISPLILCRVATVKLCADQETDVVFSKIKLIPLRNSELDFDDGDDDDESTRGSKKLEKLASFSKTLTQSDAKNGEGFSISRYWHNEI